MVTAQDPFAVDTTVFNISEINEIGSRYGNPGMVFSLQVSMSTRPEALIELSRKLRAKRGARAQGPCGHRHARAPADPSL